MSTFFFNFFKIIGSEGWTRTSNPLINSQMHYHCATSEYLVGRTGFEPVTNWLKANCSTDWANDPNIYSSTLLP